MSKLGYYNLSFQKSPPIKNSLRKSKKLTEYEEYENTKVIKRNIGSNLIYVLL